MTTREGRVRWVVALALAVGLGACGDDGAEDAVAPPADETTTTAATEDDTGDDAAELSADIVIEGSTFSVAGPVPADQAIAVNNLDPYEHTVTADDPGAFDVPIGASGSTEVASLAPGSYDFHCEIHPAMQATLVIE